MQIICLLQKEYMSQETREILENLKTRLKNIDKLKQTVDNKLKKRALI